ncbi:hypothetical protein AAG747_22600 [Rapidithrix thailandica]|uniref:DUF4397 domain-containing protein n=1 Tax=Rapidithrix thailandica TaxID=413964 RepID=A0AAW9SHH3_9BACT
MGLISGCGDDDDNGPAPSGSMLLLINTVNTNTQVKLLLESQELVTVTGHGAANKYITVPSDTVLTVQTNQDEFDVDLGLTTNEFYSVYILEDDDDADISIFRDHFPNDGQTTLVLANMSSENTGDVKFAFINPSTSDTLGFEDIFPGANPVLEHDDVTGLNFTATSLRLNLFATHQVVILDADDDSPLAGGTANDVFPMLSDYSYSLVFAGEPGNYSIFQVSHTTAR